MFPFESQIPNIDIDWIKKNRSIAVPMLNIQRDTTPTFILIEFISFCFFIFIFKSKFCVCCFGMIICLSELQSLSSEKFCFFLFYKTENKNLFHPHLVIKFCLFWRKTNNRNEWPIKKYSFFLLRLFQFSVFLTFYL